MMGWSYDFYLFFLFFYFSISVLCYVWCGSCCCCCCYGLVYVISWYPFIGRIWSWTMKVANVVSHTLCKCIPIKSERNFDFR